jgi:hypothetical protein
MSPVVMLKERNEVRNTGGTFTSAATIFIQVELAFVQDFQTSTSGAQLKFFESI